MKISIAYNLLAVIVTKVLGSRLSSDDERLNDNIADIIEDNHNHHQRYQIIKKKNNDINKITGSKSHPSNQNPEPLNEKTEITEDNPLDISIHGIVHKYYHTHQHNTARVVKSAKARKSAKKSKTSKSSPKSCKSHHTSSKSGKSSSTKSDDCLSIPDNHDDDKQPDWDSTTSIDWGILLGENYNNSNFGIRMKASAFYYQQHGKPLQYLSKDFINALDMEIWGYGGEYNCSSTLEQGFAIEWPKGEEAEHRLLFMLVSPLHNHDVNVDWKIVEARFYDYDANDGDGDWIRFNKYGYYQNSNVTNVSGLLGKCFKSDLLVIMNNDGDKIVFKDFHLATFVNPELWTDEEEYNKCFL